MQVSLTAAIIESGGAGVPVCNGAGVPDSNGASVPVCSGPCVFTEVKVGSLSVTKLMFQSGLVRVP